MKKNFLLRSIGTIDHSSSKIKVSFGGAGTLKRFFLIFMLFALQLFHFFLSLPLYIFVSPLRYEKLMGGDGTGEHYRMRRIILLCSLFLIVALITVQFFYRRLFP